MPDLTQRVAARLDAMRPYLERSGGRVELVVVEDAIARVRVSLTRPGPSRLIDSLQLASGIERLLRRDIPELRGIEATNLPPYSEIGWDQPGFTPVELPVPAAGSAAGTAAPGDPAAAASAASASGSAGGVRERSNARVAGGVDGVSAR